MSPSRHTTSRANKPALSNTDTLRGHRNCWERHILAVVHCEVMDIKREHCEYKDTQPEPVRRDLEQSSNDIYDRHAREAIAHVVEVVGAERKGLKSDCLLFVCDIKNLVGKYGKHGHQKPETSRARDEDTGQEERQEGEERQSIGFGLCRAAFKNVVSESIEEKEINHGAIDRFLFEVADCLFCLDRSRVGHFLF